ncbi:NAD(P)/FAD-dependent oxidoreductase [Nocardia seriolae]|uniref:NADH dehydrogenase n=1 Tax=Nocardia seriolae TaxID=37332 RepID=A0A0B8N8L9_9NOCA|nr:FAD-dependent oxidoreductase [Nocardia seriolae]APA99733.1 NADH dehydrogenase [Nocardia seriolae]MTJ62670.1 FAD-dependent oxidoreductase [Nocardia seriolae]MTJ73692.1 FAD-dependent oxidoreductase [Nocardia seriolae]MTJ89288.1 FAD-dependent oxidoreductase [Nocardia seriolae]MTK33266.1 FAD-dependent oxidoreductase [Nocardia seriolae]
MNANATVHEIVVLGAGYTGMIAAVRLARRTRKMNVRITLVNPSDRFTERLRVHQIAAGQELADHRIPAILDGSGVVFHRAAALAIDTAGRIVTLDDATELHYDNLIYALGSSTDTSLVPGADQHAWTLNDPRLARRFSRRLTEIAAAAGTVTVVGGGLTGIEAATEIAEAHPELTVTLVSARQPGDMMGERARAHLERALDRLGIVRKIGVKVTKVLPDAVRLDTGEFVASDLTLWTTGVKVSPLAAEAGIAVDARGLIVTDPTLRSVSHPEIHAIGDAAAVRMAWGQIHGTCQSGIPTGTYTADTLARVLRGKTLRPFRFGYFHQPVSLGRQDAVIQFTKADDTPNRWYLKGKAAVAYKAMVSGSPVPSFKMSKHMTVQAQLSNGGRATRETA